MRFVLLVFFVSSFLFCQDQNEKFVTAPFEEGSKPHTPKLEIQILHDELLPISKSDFLILAQEIFQYECKRMNFTKDIHLTVEIKDLTKDISGEALPESTKISLSKDSIKNLSLLKGIFAHELGHIISFGLLNPPSQTYNMYWNEGFASWAAGKYYLQWQGYQNYDSAIKEIVSLNRFYDIKNIYSEKPRHAKQRDVIYLEWTSFVDFLIEEYGFEKFIVLTTLFIKAGKETLNQEVIIKNDSPLLATISDRGDIPDQIVMRCKNAYKKIYSHDFDALKKQWKLRNKITK